MYNTKSIESLIVSLLIFSCLICLKKIPLMVVILHRLIDLTKVDAHYEITLVNIGKHVPNYSIIRINSNRS